MNKKNTYYVPVETRTTSTLVVKANSELDAIAQVQVIINKNKEVGHTIYDSIKIVRERIECEQDDEILDDIINDFGLETKKSYGSIVTTEEGVHREVFEHKVNTNA